MKQDEDWAIVQSLVDEQYVGFVFIALDERSRDRNMPNLLRNAAVHILMVMIMILNAFALVEIIVMK